MSSSWMPERLTQLLGSMAEELVGDALGKLIGVREGDDFEVKSETYGSGDSDKRELCADVASFANAQGGLLLIGAREEDDVVVELTPIVLANEDLRLRSVVAGGVIPPVDITTRAIEHEAGRGSLLIAVPSSPMSPHAVVKDNDLRYPVRDGAGKRWMREPEVADRYRRRFAAAASRLEQLDAVDVAVRSRIARDSEDAWLVVSGVPDGVGRLPINLAGKESTVAWLRQVTSRMPGGSYISGLGQEVTTGFRRYVAGQGSLDQRGGWSHSVCELHSDGSVGVASVVGEQWGRSIPESPLVPEISDDTTVNTISDTRLAIAVLSALRLIGSHAQRAGSLGAVNVIATLQSERPFVLGNTRIYGFAQRISGSRVLAETERSTHTFAVDDLLVPARLVAAASLVTGDLQSALGLAECLQLTPGGTVRRRYVDNAFQSLIGWATANGVEVSDEIVD